MQNISLKSIKWESVKSIFGVIADRDSVSRAEISEATGLSLMTVSKAADALLSMGIVRQVKESRPAAGRRTGRLSVNPAHFAVILDLTSRDFFMTVINVKLDKVAKYPFSYSDDFVFEENLVRFLKGVKQYLTTEANPDECIGIGVSLPGSYLSDTDRTAKDRVPGLSSIPIAETVKKYLPGFPLYIDASVNAAATSNTWNLPNFRDSVILYWFVGDQNVCGSIVEGGEILRGAHNAAGDFGQMAVTRGRTVESVIRASNTPDENASILACAIHNVMMIVDPDRIIIECELYKSRDAFVDLVRSCLYEQYGHTEDTLPPLTSSRCKFRHSHRGLTMKLREMWLSRRIFSDDE